MLETIIAFLFGLVKAIGLSILVCAGLLVLFVFIQTIIEEFRGDE